MKLFSRTTLKRAAMIALAAIFGFSNIVSLLLYRAGTPELARHAAIPEARAALIDAGSMILDSNRVSLGAENADATITIGTKIIYSLGINAEVGGDQISAGDSFTVFWENRTDAPGVFNTLGTTGQLIFVSATADTVLADGGTTTAAECGITQAGSTFVAGRERETSAGNSTAPNQVRGNNAWTCHQVAIDTTNALAGKTYAIRINQTHKNGTVIFDYLAKIITPAGAATTTLGNGTDPGNASLAPGGAATMADAFTFATNTGTDSVTAVVAGLAAGTSGGLSLIEITNDAGTVVHGSVANPASDTPSITLGTAISVTTTATQYKIRITPKSHANMPAPPGATYSVTAKINSWTGTNATAGTDTAGTTVTIDNTSPGNVTAASGTAGNTQVTLNYTTPADTDLNSVVILRNTVAVTATPTEGATYIAGDPVGVDTAACIDATVAASTADSCAATGLTNGTAYHFKIFVKDANGNYSATGVVPTGSPVTPVANTTTIADGTNPGNATIGPGDTVTDLDAFTLVTSAGTDTVTAATVTLGPVGAFNNIGQADITNSANTAQCTAITNPASNTLSFTGCTLAVTTTAATFKVRITPKTHAAMPAVPGTEYATTGTVTAFTSTNTQAGTDTTSATITVDNLSPSGATLVSGTAGNAANTINWTTSSSADFIATSGSVVLRWTAATAGAEVPAEGSAPAIGSANGTATAACVVSSAASTALSRVDGTGGSADCTTTALTNGQAYTYKVFQKDTRGNYDVGVLIGTLTPTAPPATLTIGATTGAKIATKNSGAVDQYTHDTTCTGAASCAAFTLAASGGTVNVTSIKITESGTATANTELSDLNLYWETTNNGWQGTETLFGTAATFAADQTATVSGTLAISAGATAYIYVRYDLANVTTYPIGGATVNFQIAAATDVVSDGTESGSGALAGTQTVKPDATAVTYAVAPDGGRSGNSATVSGFGFGAPVAGVGRENCIGAVDTGCVRFIVGGAATILNANITAWSNTSIAFTITATGLATFGGASALEVVAGSQNDSTALTYVVYPNITSVTTPLVADAARETESITLNGDHFDVSVNQGTVNFSGGFGAVAAAITTWSDTAVTLTVPTAISDSIYLGDITLTRAAATGSKTDLAYGANTLRILPKIASTAPVNLKGGRSDTISITGDHLCQSGACPTAFSATDKVSFAGPAEVTAGASTWTHTSAPSVVIPTAAIDGGMTVTSNTSFTSNSLTYDIKFAPTTPTNSSPTNGATGVSQNPTITGSAFSDGTDGDTHIDAQWQVAHNSDVDFATPEWSRTATIAEATIVVNATNGTFANGDVGQTLLDCGTVYKWRVRYKDNSGVTSQEFSVYSTETTFTTTACGPNATSSATSPAELTDGARIGQTVVITGVDFGTVAAGSRANCIGAAGTGCVKIGGTGGNIITNANITAWAATSITVNITATDVGALYGGATTSGLIVYAAGISDGDGLTFFVYPDITSLSVVEAREGDTITITGNKFGTGTTGAAVTILGAASTLPGDLVADVSCDATDGWAETCIKITITTAINDATDSGQIVITQGTGSNNKTVSATDSQAVLGILPRITGIAAASFADGGFQNGTLTLNGSHFGATAGSITVNGVAQDGTPTWGVSSITSVGIPDTGTDSGSITLTRSDTKTSNASSTFYIYPQITGFTAAQTDGDVQTGTITISGNHLGATGTASNISVNGAAPASIGVWSATSVPTIDIPNTGTDSGTITITRASDSKASNASSAFYIYPDITSITVPTAATDAAREHNVSDSDGVITLNGSHLGTGGSVTILGSAATQVTTGTCTTTAYQATCTGLQAPAAIADTLYTGNIILTRTVDTKTDTYAGFRILPRTLGTSPASGIVGDTVQVTGNHFCQTGTCPTTLGSRSVAADNVKFGITQAADLVAGNDFVNAGGAPCSVLTTAWNHTELCVKVPAGTPAGSQPVTVRSNNFDSDTEPFTRASSAPSDPSNLYQFKTNTNLAEPPITNVAVGGGVNQTNAWLRATGSAGVNQTLCIQVEVKTVASAFDGTGTVDGASPDGCKSFTVGTPVVLFVNVPGLTDNNYKWRARIKNTIPEFSNWINASVDGNGISFYIDTVLPTISIGTPPSCTSNPSGADLTASSATIRWSPAGDTQFTRQVEYSTDSNLVGSTCTPGSTCGTPTSGYGANPQIVTLTNLSANTPYYYRLRSKDRADNEVITPSASPYCSFTTSKAQTKTIEHFIVSNTSQISVAQNTTFPIYLTESTLSGFTLQDIFVEVSGIAPAGSGSITVGVKVYGSNTSVLYTNYSVPIAAGVVTPFTLLHKVDWSTVGLYIQPRDGSSVNTFSITPTGSTIDIASAKVIVTYYHPPVQ